MDRNIECAEGKDGNPCPLCVDWQTTSVKLLEHWACRNTPRRCIAFGAIPQPDSTGCVYPFSKEKPLRDPSSVLFVVMYDIMPGIEGNFKVEPVLTLCQFNRRTLGGERGTPYRRSWLFAVRHNEAILAHRHYRPAFSLANEMNRQMISFAKNEVQAQPLDYLPHAVLGFRTGVPVAPEPDLLHMRQAVIQAYRDGSRINGKPLPCTCAPCDATVADTEPIPGNNAEMHILLNKFEDGSVVRVRVPTTANWLIEKGAKVAAGQQLFCFGEPRHLSYLDWGELAKELNLCLEWFTEEVFNFVAVTLHGYRCWPSSLIDEQVGQAARSWVDIEPMLQYLRPDGTILCPPIDRPDMSDESLSFFNAGVHFNLLFSDKRDRRIELAKARTARRQYYKRAQAAQQPTAQQPTAQQPTDEPPPEPVTVSKSDEVPST